MVGIRSGFLLGAGPGNFSGGYVKLRGGYMSIYLILRKDFAISLENMFIPNLKGVILIANPNNAFVFFWKLSQNHANFYSLILHQNMGV